MMRPIYLNGRFLSQALTGVQRFAREITASLDRLWAPADPHAPTMLIPRIPQQATNYRTIRVKPVGKMRGHVWEQLELPRIARDGILINLANAGPVIAKQQLVVLHDASIFAHPEAYSVPYRVLHSALDRMLAGSWAKLATVSRFSRDEIARYLHIPPSEIEIIPEGADHIRRVDSDPAVLGRHGLTPGRYVLAVGSLVAHKNLSSLHSLAQMLGRRGLEFAVVGSVSPGVYHSGSVTLPQSAKYLGRVSDGALRALYENAICFVFPSRYEGFGIPPVEAFACSCPVVAARAGAVMEVCGEAALYCDPDDSLQIAATVGRLIDEPSLASELRERGRKRVQTLTWDNAAAALARLVERLQQESQRGAHESRHRPRMARDLCRIGTRRRATARLLSDRGSVRDCRFPSE